MPTAVPATVPPSRLCTKFVPPIVFAKEVLGTISILFFPKHASGMRGSDTNMEENRFHSLVQPRGRPEFRGRKNTCFLKLDHQKHI